MYSCALRHCHRSLQMKQFGKQLNKYKFQNVMFAWTKKTQRCRNNWIVVCLIVHQINHFPVSYILGVRPAGSAPEGQEYICWNVLGSPFPLVLGLAVREGLPSYRGRIAEASAGFLLVCSGSRSGTFCFTLFRALPFPLTGITMKPSEKPLWQWHFVPRKCSFLCLADASHSSHAKIDMPWWSLWETGCCFFFNEKQIYIR